MYVNHLSQTPARAAAGASACAVIVSLLVMPPPSSATTDDPPEPAFSRRCFMEQMHWNAALNGPVPRCPGPPAG